MSFILVTNLKFEYQILYMIHKNKVDEGLAVNFLALGKEALRPWLACQPHTE